MRGVKVKRLTGLDLLWLPRDAHQAFRMPVPLREKLKHMYRQHGGFFNFSDYLVAILAAHCNFRMSDAKKFRGTASPRAQQHHDKSKPEKITRGGPSRYFIKGKK